MGFPEHFHTGYLKNGSKKRGLIQGFKPESTTGLDILADLINGPEKPDDKLKEFPLDPCFFLNLIYIITLQNRDGVVFEQDDHPGFSAAFFYTLQVLSPKPLGVICF